VGQRQHLGGDPLMHHWTESCQQAARIHALDRAPGGERELLDLGCARISAPLLQRHT